MSLIEQTPDDSPEFLTRANRIVALALRSGPIQLYLVRIDNWFGARWVGFSGKVVGAAGVHLRANFTIPPFIPSRVMKQTCYAPQAQGATYVPVECAQTLHIEQTSAANLRRRVDDLLPNAAVVWFSGNSASARRGSIMAYVPSDVGHEAWYADLDGTRAWSVVQVIGLTQRELEPVPQPQPA